MFRNIPFLIFMVRDFSLKIKSVSIDICTQFWNCRWMQMIKSRLPKGSEKKVECKWKVSEKSGNFEKNIKWKSAIYHSRMKTSTDLEKPKYFSERVRWRTWRSWGQTSCGRVAWWYRSMFAVGWWRRNTCCYGKLPSVFRDMEEVYSLEGS